MVTRVVDVDRDVDVRAVTGQGLVDRVVDHLVDQVMEARPVIGVADVHAGALADALEPLQDADICLGVLTRRGRRRCGHRNIGIHGGFCHQTGLARTLGE
jgi:hypothetical protein